MFQEFLPFFVTALIAVFATDYLFSRLSLSSSKPKVVTSFYKWLTYGFSLYVLLLVAAFLGFLP
ncbi:hypothetical protein DS745_03270 [Anaerobacillus alkaliphilus]|uniref:Uncharacterized protein n=1 Tax=Anaerobacillus alkaliphilus TaxID=1548597 RepID=A0A4Q0VXY9_9BACI|nr:hypothetical protein [Anaerobacillus alkaliphilus]RXJ04419.1 hypothetical protein DS745_03270 [Anaerobacillus alkaliphilus]